MGMYDELDQAGANGDIVLYMQCLDRFDMPYELGFHRACEHGRLNIIKHLLGLPNNEININADIDYAFRRTCLNGQLEVVKYLLSFFPPQMRS